VNQNILIEKSEIIKNALEKLEKNKKKFLICVNNDNEFLGTITDGDIRRGFLIGLTLNNRVEQIYNSKCYYIYENSSFEEVCEIFRNPKIEFLPILNKNNKVINIITKKQFHIMLLEDVEFDLLYNFENLDESKLEQEIYNRPWGFYKSTILTSHSQGKIITVFPNEELSLQEHKKREEHWVIIKGKGKVILGESILSVYPGKYIYIPKGCKHKIINTSDNENLIFSEVQLGEYFGEDDIIRYEDKYGRIKKENK